MGTGPCDSDELTSIEFGYSDCEISCHPEKDIDMSDDVDGPYMEPCNDELAGLSADTWLG